MRLRETERLAQSCTARGVLNGTDPAYGCDFLFLPRAPDSQALQSDLVVAKSGDSCGRASQARDARWREPAVTGPLAPSGGRAKTGGGGQPARDPLPRAYGLFPGGRTSRFGKQKGWGISQAAGDGWV